MKLFRIVVGFIPLLVAGCIGTTAISVDDLPWTIRTLSKVGCPNLDGRYMDRGFLHLNFFVGLTGSRSDRSNDVFPATVEWIRSPYRSGLPMDEMYRLEREFAKTSVVTIKSDHEKIIVTLEDSAGLIYQKVTLKTNVSTMIGCNGGVLVLRHKSVHGKGEGSNSTVEFGESEIRKLPDGGLEIIGREWSSPTSALFGVGTVESREEARNIFPPVKR